MSIIVYRNPVEKAFWEAIMSGNLLVFIIFFFVAVAVIVGLCRFLDKVVPYKYRKWAVPVSLITGFITAFYAVHLVFAT